MTTKQIEAIARRAANVVQDRSLREIAYYTVLQHLYELEWR